jgi:chromosome segregation ATPase
MVKAHGGQEMKIDKTGIAFQYIKSAEGDAKIGALLADLQAIEAKAEELRRTTLHPKEQTAELAGLLDQAKENYFARCAVEVAELDEEIDRRRLKYEETRRDAARELLRAQQHRNRLESLDDDEIVKAAEKYIHAQDLAEIARHPDDLDTLAACLRRRGKDTAFRNLKAAMVGRDYQRPYLMDEEGRELRRKHERLSKLEYGNFSPDIPGKTVVFKIESLLEGAEK